MTNHSDPNLPPWLDVSRETIERLRRLVALVERWTPAINLVSKSSVAQLWTRHILDSAQLFRLSFVESGVWLDLGSGAGFPGLVVAVLAHEKAPRLRVTLVEADQRKATFLMEAGRQLDVGVTVLARRIETLAPQNAHVLSARALAPLPVLCGYAERHLNPDGVALFQKGGQVAEELALARGRWQFDMIAHASLTEAAGNILAIRGISHV